ncbi:ABC transporter ATP-binding protein [Ralstonia sp. CHL-2022]|uniref:ABC transporter ATP-binding protein n=1 Tax=Ralstonia mojiangensis TaxID=2953895 RepID=A0ABT2L8T9_9RALS|nr:ABC transporter ATP-binding protein [Ralstonia mojiangensis]MCT7299003.1 ABC transporter ATP-binding protein [Ralstonia mojiangensis]MCT7311342.1 ABC transporter ATP-binding protein [Ralstonia mojiangensis]
MAIVNLSRAVPRETAVIAAANPAAQDMTARVMIDVDNVGKRFAARGGAAAFNALEDVSMQVRQRDFVSILGPSGCGKSTLLRMVAGLVPCDAGEIRVDGKSIAAPVPEIGVVFQTSNMLPWLTVGDNIRLGAKLRNLPSVKTEARLPGLLDTLGLTQFVDRYPHELSGGMRQRAAIGQILLLEPRVMLMDEPFGALDALTRDKLNVELLRIWQQSTLTVLLVTHSIHEAVFLSDRVLVMSPRPGRVQHDVKIDLPRPRQPDEIKRDPRYGEYVSELSRMMGVF